MTSTLLKTVGYPDAIAEAAARDPDQRKIIERLAEKVHALDRDPLYVIARVPPEYWLEVATLFDTVGAHAGRPYRKLLCDHCRKFLLSYVERDGRLRDKRSDSRFCDPECSANAARRRRAGLSEDAPGGRGHAFERSS